MSLIQEADAGSHAGESTSALTVLNPWFQLLEQFGWCLLCLKVIISIAEKIKNTIPVQLL